jgi:hypothetical protein
MFFKKKKKPKERKGLRRIKLKLTHSDYKKQLDTLFSLYIREKADWKCANPACKRHLAPWPRGSNQLTASHYVVRQNLKLRWDEVNVIPLCWMPCHQRWESQKNTAYRQYMIDTYEEDKVKELELIENVTNTLAMPIEDLRKLPAHVLLAINGKVTTSDIQAMILVYEIEYERLCNKKGVPMLWDKESKKRKSLGS